MEHTVSSVSVGSSHSAAITIEKLQSSERKPSVCNTLERMDSDPLSSRVLLIRGLVFSERETLSLIEKFRV